MKGFKHTGRGPKSGHSFSSKAGFTHSGTNKQNVKGYTRSAPKKAYATGGIVTTPMASGDSAVIKRMKPVTGFDAEHGGKGPLRPGFNKGGKACYAEGGKVATTGAAIKMMKELMKRGNSAEDAAAKAARRYGVQSSQIKPSTSPMGGGGMSADKQLLAKGGPVGAAPRGQLSRGQGSSPMASRSFVPSPQGQKAPGRVAHHGYGSFGRRPLVG